MKKQPWIHSAWLDGIFILGPAFAATLFGWWFSVHFSPLEEIPLWGWVLFILCVDVAHVYSTLFRTYFDPDEVKNHSSLYITIPLLCWIVGVWCYSIGGMFFWRVLAYLAVFHFIRQQYGFLRLYSLEDHQQPWAQSLDQAAIYLATIYPLVYWHTHMPRNYHWFVDGDFVAIPWSSVSTVVCGAYFAVLIAYVIKEAWSVSQDRWNLPKNLLMAGTVLSWYLGIITFNGDMAFTATNVVAHGIPYMALIWIYGSRKAKKDDQKSTEPFRAQLRSVCMRYIPLYLGLMVLFAFLEEGLWDGLVWRDHSGLFNAFWHLPLLSDPTTLSWVVPFLALPQSTHYVLDGFIWRLKSPAKEWKDYVFRPAPWSGIRE